MNRYRILKVLGDGSFGTVMAAQNQETDENVTRLASLTAPSQTDAFHSFANTNQVAIKKMKKKYYSWGECIALREVKVMISSLNVNVSKMTARGR
jgi:protein kinase